LSWATFTGVLLLVWQAVEGGGSSPTNFHTGTKMGQAFRPNWEA
jgi:hypothetical protein